MNEHIHLANWRRDDHRLLEKITTFEELADLAVEILQRRYGSIHMISGPISTGGVGTVEGNIKVFCGAIELFWREYSQNVFSQIPFEDKLAELAEPSRGKDGKGTYCMPILEVFYERIFSSNKISSLHFIHGWESSFGARWEHDNCDRWGIERHYFDERYSQRVLSGDHERLSARTPA